jgi:hypothetical protein
MAPIPYMYYTVDGVYQLGSAPERWRPLATESFRSPYGFSPDHKINRKPLLSVASVLNVYL